MDFESKRDFGNIDEFISPFVNSERKKVDIVKLIENESHLDFNDKACLLLTSEGIKPATIISLSYEINEESSEIKLQQSIISLRKILSVGKLPYRTKRSRDKEDGYIGIKFLIGKDRESLRKLLKEDREGKVGISLGYPKTAVDAFNKGIEYQADLLDLPRDMFLWYMKFTFFVLSKSHWQKELEIISKWTRVIEELSPKIYQEMLVQTGSN